MISMSQGTLSSPTRCSCCSKWYVCIASCRISSMGRCAAFPDIGVCLVLSRCCLRRTKQLKLLSARQSGFMRLHRCCDSTGRSAQCTARYLRFPLLAPMKAADANTAALLPLLAEPRITNVNQLGDVLSSGAQPRESARLRC